MYFPEPFVSSDHKIIEREITGDVLVNSDSQYNNINADNVTVGPHVTVRFFGTIKKTLVIHEGARVYMHGSMPGKVENLGGEFYKY
jgi:hypothetical protein